MPDFAGPAGFGQYPGAVVPRRGVAHMLVMAAIQLGNPVPFIIKMKANDDAFHAGSESGLFDKLGFQLHCADAFDFAVDVVIAFDEADILYLGANLDDR